MSQFMMINQPGFKAKQPALTQADVEEYVRRSGDACPHCGQHSLAAAGSMQIGPGYASLPVRCQHCRRQWQDCYALVGIKEMQSPENQYFFAETDADRASQALIDEIELLLQQRDANNDRLDQGQEEVFQRLLKVLNQISPEVVTQRYLRAAAQISAGQSVG